MPRNFTVKKSNFPDLFYGAVRTKQFAGSGAGSAFKTLLRSGFTGRTRPSGSRVSWDASCKRSRAHDAIQDPLNGVDVSARIDVEAAVENLVALLDVRTSTASPAAAAFNARLAAKQEQALKAGTQFPISALLQVFASTMPGLADENRAPAIASGVSTLSGLVLDGEIPPFFYGRLNSLDAGRPMPLDAWLRDAAKIKLEERAFQRLMLTLSSTALPDTDPAAPIVRNAHAAVDARYELTIANRRLTESLKMKPKGFLAALGRAKAESFFSNDSASSIRKDAVLVKALQKRCGPRAARDVALLLGHLSLLEEKTLRLERQSGFHEQFYMVDVEEVFRSIVLSSRRLCIDIL